MIFLNLLCILSFSRKCRYNIFPKLGQPSNETFYVDEGEHICINSTANYLSVLFHNSLLSVRYFTSEKSPSTQTQILNLIEEGKFLFPSEKGGVSFPKNAHASVDITALVPGNVTISTFIFPNECTYGRYVSTESSLNIPISKVFDSFKDDNQANQALCFWYAENEFNFQPSEVPTKDNKIMVCQNQVSCKEPISRLKQFTEVKSPGFIKIIPKDKDFWSDLNLLFTSFYPTNLFQISGIMKDDKSAVPYSLSIKKLEEEDDNQAKVNPKDADKNDDDDDDKNNNNNNKIEHDNDNDDDHEETNQKNSLSDTISKNIPRGHKRSRKSNSESYGTLIIILSAFVCVFLVLCVVIYVISIFGSCSKRKSSQNDHSEERLLPNNQAAFFPGFPMQWGQHPPGQGFFTGVFPAFSGAPGQTPSNFTAPGASFQPVPNGFQQDNKNDDENNDTNDNGQKPQQMQYQQPVMYMVPPQYQQQFLQQQQQYMQQFQNQMQNQNQAQQNQNQNQQNQQPAQQNPENKE